MSGIKKQRRLGFSMVEVVLAVLILGVGVLSVVGLMSGGLQMSKGGIEDMQVAMFAGDIMEGMQRYAAVATNNTIFRNQIRNAFTALPLTPVAGPLWAGSQTIQLKTSLSAQPSVFYYAPQTASTNVDFVCRYHLLVNTAPADIPASQANRVAAIRMNVQGGRFGLTTTQSFYREVFQFVK